MHHFILRPTAGPKSVLCHLWTFLGCAFCAGCWDFDSLLLSWVLMEKLSHWQQKKQWCQALLSLSMYSNYTSFPVIKRSGDVRSCCLTMVRRSFYQNAFLNMAQWPVICGVTLHKSYNFAWSWCSPLRGEMDTICEAAQGHDWRSGSGVERNRLRVQCHTDQCVTLGTLLDLPGLGFILLNLFVLLNRHENWSSHIEPMWELNEVMYLQCFSQLPGTY